MTAILEVEKVVKHFGALRAVDGISFAVEEGEIFGVAGPNGSGKSTLFNIVTGVPYSAQSGVVRFKGAQIERLAPHRICRLGLVRTFQRDAVFPSLTVRENVGLAILYGARARLVARAERSRRRHYPRQASRCERGERGHGGDDLYW